MDLVLEALRALQKRGEISIEGDKYKVKEKFFSRLRSELFQLKDIGFSIAFYKEGEVATGGHDGGCGVAFKRVPSWKELKHKMCYLAE